MIYFLDASALVKRYVEETGSSEVRRLFRRRVEIAVARITEAEVAAALARATRKSEISAEQRERAFALLAADMDSARVIEIRAPVIRSVRDLVVRWPLRAYDAVQLACAMRLRAAGSVVDFWCADEALVTAARGEGLRSRVL